jgi:hypothetical protein
MHELAELLELFAKLLELLAAEFAEALALALTPAK